MFLDTVEKREIYNFQKVLFRIWYRILHHGKQPTLRSSLHMFFFTHIYYIGNNKDKFLAYLKFGTFYTETPKF